MAYAHYWRRVPELNRDAFVKAVDDIKKIIDELVRRGVRLAGPKGHGKPELSDITIAFNGEKECGHRYQDLGDPWPSRTAEGFCAVPEPVEGPWFSGALLATRACGGSCAAEPFYIDRNHLVRKWEVMERGGYFCRCETRYKPYDLAVTAALVRLKERLGDEIHISSDGFERGFEEGKKLCRELFGWHTRFELEPQESEVV